MSEPASARLPAPFGKYLLTQLIAVGGMAEVYRAKIFGASGFEKEMVVKRILPKYAQNPNFVQMLIDEAKIAVSLSHGNIVPIYELGELEGSYYIAMEYVEGRTVLDILRDAHSKRHPIGWPHCFGVAADVARGLAYAHSRADAGGKPLGLVHRDINPRNIVVTPAGEVKILDFGIARASTKKHQTASGVIKGTPGYMSPEQMYGQSMDSRSDIYCVGILLYELLTLRRLFPVWDVAEMRAVFEAGPIPLPSTLAKHVAPAVDAVVMRALTQDMSKRYQNASDFEEDLRTVIARSGVAVTSAGLAREVLAVDNAPGPRAPTTSPAVVSSQIVKSVATANETATSVAHLAVSAKSRASAALAAQSALTPPPMLNAEVAPLREAQSTQTMGNAVDVKHHGVLTQTMQGHGPPGNIDAAHSFVISLAGIKPSPMPLEPLPAGASTMERGRTMVLAQNAALNWTQAIGDDAELLALMKATGAAPGAGRRTLLTFALVIGIAVAVAFALAGRDIRTTVTRALTGKKQELGVVVIKTVPSGAVVTLDGKARGKTNLKIAGIDVDDAHVLVIAPVGEPVIRVEFTREQFQQGDDGKMFVFEKTFEKPLTPKAAP